MASDLIASIDCGTQSVKAIIFTVQGEILLQDKEPIRTDYYDGGRAEQDASSWWTALCSIMNRIDHVELAGVSVTYQRETFILLDEEFKPIRPAILWLDHRAVGEAEEIAHVIGRDEFRRITGKPLNATPSLTKLLWLKRNEVESWNRMRHIMTVGAYIHWKLTGNLCDCTAGSDTTGLYDINTESWSSTLMELLGIDPFSLFTLVQPGAYIGDIISEEVTSSSFVNVPVYASGGDGQVFALGAGAISDTEMALTLGTSGVCGIHSTVSSNAITNRKMVSCLPHAYLYEAVILSAANSLSWFIRNFHDQSLGNSTPEEEMEQEIALIPAGANGLLTMPYFSGCMMPYDDPMSRGVTLGWSNVHTKAHLYRSLLEGVAFELKLIIENYEKEFNNRVSLVKVGGGGAQSDLWLQIIADVTGIETIVTSTTENSALGAAIITACSAGLYDNYFTAVEKMCSITKRFYPNETQQLLYDQLFHDVYQHIYPDLQKYLRILGSN